MKRELVVVVLGLFALCRPSARASDVAPAEVEHALKEGLLEIWFPRILDKEHGGFLCDFDYEWKPAGSQPKTIVCQARSTWLASRAVLKYPQDPRYLEAARHGFRFLRDVQWDKQDGGWFFHLDREGKLTAEWQGLKHAYGVGFGIYACSAYYKVTKDPEGLELAKKGFRWLDQHGHDAKSGGYFEFFARDGTPILDEAHNPLHGHDRDAIGTRVGYKSMNTHIHLLEALTALYEVWPDDAVRQRLSELHAIVRDRIVAPPGAMHLFFNSAWTPVPDHDSFGHDVETGYLLLESAGALGEQDDARTASVAKSLVDHALDFGWDTKNAGFWEGGGTFGPIFDREKIWWTQAEGLNSLQLLARLYPTDKRNYEKLFDRQWAYVKVNFIDSEHGDWYPSGLDAGGDAKAHKASEWKAGYHDGRALFNVLERLEQRK